MFPQSEKSLKSNICFALEPVSSLKRFLLFSNKHLHDFELDDDVVRGLVRKRKPEDFKNAPTFA